MQDVKANGVSMHESGVRRNDGGPLLDLSKQDLAYFTGYGMEGRN